MRAWTAERTTAEALAELADARIPCGEVLTPAQALTNEQVVDRGFLADTDYPGLPRPAPVGRMPVDFSAVDTGVKRRAPTLGEHTAEILLELGYTKRDVDALRAKGIV